MDWPHLYDLSPVGRLLVVGALVAALPLAWALRRRTGASSESDRLRQLTWVTLFLTFDLVLFGAFTRLTDSGLGCPDWPGCYGHASPVGAGGHIAAAQAAMPTGPVTLSKAWIEMIHRYLASGVGALILVLAVLTWWHRRRIHVSPWWPTVTLVWVCIQGAFGALTVTMKLFPAIVTLHLLGGLVLLALLRHQSLLYQSPSALAMPSPTACRAAASARALRWGVYGVTALVWLQIALGGWVSTNYAVLACTSFPTCQGAWWPDMDWRNGFTLWRELGVNASGEALPFPALTAIHVAHRLGAVVVVLAVLALAVALWRLPPMRRAARGLVLLAGWQVVTGLSNVVLGWPLLAAVAHTGGAAALVIWLAGLGRGVVDASAATPFPLPQAPSRVPVR